MYDDRPYVELIAEHSKIYNSTHTGGNKTTKAIEFIENEVKKNRSVIILMQSYEILKAAFYNRFSRETKNRTVCLKGRSQPGMCTEHPNIKKYYVIIKPKINCKDCSNLEFCQYTIQKRKIQTLLSDNQNQGIVILTVPSMMKAGLQYFNQNSHLKPTIIIDDVPFSQIISDEFYLSREQLSKLSEYCKNHNLNGLSQICNIALNGDLEDIISNYNQNVHQVDLDKQTLQSALIALYNTNNCESFESIPKFTPIFTLLDNIKNKTEIIPIHHPILSHNNQIKYIFIDKSIETNNVIYLNASRTKEDDYYLNRIGEWYKIEKDADINKDFIVIQFNQHTYSQNSICDPNSAVYKKLLPIFQLINPYTLFLEINIPFFTHNKAIDHIFNTEEFSSFNVEKIGYRTSKTRATNEYSDSPLSIVFGTPYLPPSYFLDCAFQEYWRPLDEIEEDIENNKKFIYPISRELSNICAKEHLIQVIGRTLRENTDVDYKKIVLLFTDIDVSDECRKQNGSEVIDYIHASYIKNKSFSKLLRNTFDPLVKIKLIDELNKRLDIENEVKLHKFCKEMAEKTDLKYNYKAFERIIKSNPSFKVETRNSGDRSHPENIVFRNN